MMKSKISLSIFTPPPPPLNFNFNADFQNFNAEIPFTPSYLELCVNQKMLIFFLFPHLTYDEGIH